MKLLIGGVSDKKSPVNQENTRLSFAENMGPDGYGKIKILVARTVKKAKRQNIWRRVSSLGRSFIGLCLSLPIQFRGASFLRALAKILSEIQLLMNSTYRNWVHGREIAYRLSEVAYRWGNKDALNWRYDRDFTIYCGLFLYTRKTLGVWS